MTISSSGIVGSLYPKLLVGTIATSVVMGLFHPTWRVVQDVPELQAPPYNPNIVLGMKYTFTVVSSAVSTSVLRRRCCD